MSMLSNLRDELMKKIYEAPLKILQKQIDELVMKNPDRTLNLKAVHISPVDAKFGFTVNQTVFSSSAGKAIAANKLISKAYYRWNPLDSNLKPEFDKLWDLHVLVNGTREKVNKFLTLVLREAKTYAEARDLLPDNLARLCENLKYLARSEGCVFEPAPQIAPLYFQLKPNIDYFVSLRLLAGIHD